MNESIRNLGGRAALAAALCLVAVTGCAPTKKVEQPKVEKKPIETRKTIGKTTQNVLELSEALKQGGVPAEMSITGEGIDAYADAYRTTVGKGGSMAVDQRMSLYQAEHGELPKTHAEFMDLIIGKGKPDGLNLPMLPYYQEWAYDTEAKKLVVVEFPAKKEQRKQETTGASGL